MKKITFLGFIASSLITPFTAFAQLQINKPSQGFSDLGTFTTGLLQIAFVLAIFMVLIMLIWGAFEWITSGGDKEAVGHARNRIINALIGLAVLSVAFALAKLGGQFVGINLGNIAVPGPQ